MPRLNVRNWLLTLLVVALVPLSAELVLAQRRGGGHNAGTARSSGSARQSNRTSRSEVSVRGYYRRDGSYVAPHKRTAADGNFYNNWSTYGNTNPYTGRPGTKTTPPAGYGEDVWVNGYYRSDGTYVPGHYRTAPDGDASNNYSTHGNENPYTGEPGTRSLPRTPASPNTSVDGVGSSPTAYSFENANRDARYRASERIRQLGYVVDWQNRSLFELSDMESRIRQAQRLGELDLSVRWSEHTLFEMSDWESRIRQSRRLAEMGLNVNWREHSLFTMSDWESRMRQARRLAELGLTVRWREHSLFEMSDWESRIRTANNLKRLGVSVDWRQYTLFQLVEMEAKARGR